MPSRQPPRKPRRPTPPLPAPGHLPRAMRHMRAGLLVLLAFSVVVLAVLLIRLVDLRGQVAPARESADATVESSRVTDSAMLVDVRWTHDGAEQTGTLRYDEDTAPPEADASVRVAFDPDDPDRVYAVGDTTLSALSSLTADILLVLAVLVVVNVIGSVRWLRRRRLTARPGEVVSVRRAKVRNRLIERSYLVLDRDGQERRAGQGPASNERRAGQGPASNERRAGQGPASNELWVPVYWDSALERIGADGGATEVTAYGEFRPRKLVAFTVDGAIVWPSGGVRAGQPRGQVREGPSGQDGPVSLARQFRVDGALLFPAPALGLLWAYVDGSGVGGFALSTVFFIGVLSWWPSYYGSDPT